MPRTSRSGTITTDHDEIRKWAEAHGGVPAAVKRKTRGDAGILRIDFPGFTGKNLEKISWDEWFETFDDSKLALLHREQDRFNKLVRREEEEEPSAARARRRPSTKRASARRSTSHAGRTTRRGATTKRSAAKSTAGKRRSTSKRGKTSARSARE